MDSGGSSSSINGVVVIGSFFGDLFFLNCYFQHYPLGLLQVENSRKCSLINQSIAREGVALHILIAQSLLLGREYYLLISDSTHHCVGSPNRDLNPGLVTFKA